MLPSLNIYCFRVNFNEIVIVICTGSEANVGSYSLERSTRYDPDEDT